MNMLGMSENYPYLAKGRLKWCQGNLPCPQLRGRPTWTAETDLKPETELSASHQKKASLALDLRLFRSSTTVTWRSHFPRFRSKSLIYHLPACERHRMLCRCCSSIKWRGHELSYHSSSKRLVATGLIKCPSNSACHPTCLVLIGLSNRSSSPPCAKNVTPSSQSQPNQNPRYSLKLRYHQ